VVSFFKSNNPGVVVFYLVYIVGFRLCFFFAPFNTDFVFNHHEPVSFFLFPALQKLPLNPLATLAVLSGLLQFVQALLVNQVINENKMTSRKTYLGGMLFILFSSFFKESLLFTPAALALTFVMLATAALFRMARKEKGYGDVFDAGMFTSLAVLIYFPTVVVLLFIFIALATVRTFRYREWTAILLGIITPVFLAFTISYVSDYTLPGILPQGWLPGLHFKTFDWVSSGVYLFCCIAPLLLMPVVIQSTLIQVRKFVTLLTILLLFLLVSFMLQQTTGLQYFILLAFPPAIISTMILSQLKNPIVAEVIHIILILLVLTGQYLPAFNLL
jgi:hypothetical protein